MVELKEEYFALRGRWNPNFHKYLKYLFGETRDFDPYPLKWHLCDITLQQIWCNFSCLLQGYDFPQLESQYELLRQLGSRVALTCVSHFFDSHAARKQKPDSVERSSVCYVLCEAELTWGAVEIKSKTYVKRQRWTGGSDWANKLLTMLSHNQTWGNAIYGVKMFPYQYKETKSWCDRLNHTELWNF